MLPNVALPIKIGGLFFSIPAEGWRSDFVAFCFPPQGKIKIYEQDLWGGRKGKYMIIRKIEKRSHFDHVYYNFRIFFTKVNLRFKMNPLRLAVN